MVTVGVYYLSESQRNATASWPVQFLPRSPLRFPFLPSYLSSSIHFPLVTVEEYTFKYTPAVFEFCIKFVQ